MNVIKQVFLFPTFLKWETICIHKPSLINIIFDVLSRQPLISIFEFSISNVFVKCITITHLTSNNRTTWLPGGTLKDQFLIDII